MKYSKKDLSDSKLEFHVELTPVEVAKHHAAAVKKLSRNVKVAGFRAGHIPSEVAEKHIDPAKLADEAINSAVNAALVELIRGENLQILDQPDIAITKFAPAQVLEFTATMEIVPEVKLAGFAKLTTHREPTKITDEQVNEVVANLANNAATKTEVKRAAKLDDEVEIDFTGYKDGEKFDGGEAKDFALTLSSHSFIPGFEEGIVGHKADDNFDLPLTFPKDYGAKKLAGAKVVFKIKLNKIREISQPKINDDFAKTIAPDLKTLDDLKKDIRRELTARAEYDANRKFQDDLLTELAEKSNIAPPEILVGDQLTALENQFAQNLAYRGNNLEKYLQDEKLSREDWISRDLRPAAEKRVRNSLALSQLSRMWNIAATDEEVHGQQDKLLAQYNDPNLRENFASDEMKRQIAQQIIADKTLAKLAEEVAK